MYTKSELKSIINDYNTYSYISGLAATVIDALDENTAYTIGDAVMSAHLPVSRKEVSKVCTYLNQAVSWAESATLR